MGQEQSAHIPAPDRFHSARFSPMTAPVLPVVARQSEAMTDELPCEAAYEKRQPVPLLLAQGGIKWRRRICDCLEILASHHCAFTALPDLIH